MVGPGGGFYRELFEACTTLMERLQAIPQPVIAQVHATATAAGCQLVASCDLAVRAAEARLPSRREDRPVLSTPMVALSAPSVRARRMEMLLTGEANLR